MYLDADLLLYKSETFCVYTILFIPLHSDFLSNSIVAKTLLRITFFYIMV